MRRALLAGLFALGLFVGSILPNPILLADQARMMNLVADNMAMGSKLALGVAILDGSGNPVTSFGGTGGTSITDDAAFTPGSTAITTVGGTYRSTLDTVDDGDSGALAMLDNRILMVHMVDDSGSAVAIGGGTQYTEAATDASITGTALMFEGAADTLVAAPGTAADGLLVNLGSNNDVTVSGTVTANLGATDNAVLDDIANGITVDLGATDNAVLDSIADGIPVTNAGTFAVQVDGTLLTLFQALDHAEDSVHSTGHMGMMMLGVRQSTQADFGADGDYTPFSIDDDGGLRVSIVAGAGSGGTALADDGDFTAGTTSATPISGFYQSTVTACTDGDACAAGITTGRALKVALSDAAGALLSVATDWTASSAIGSTAPGQMLEAKDFDGATLPQTATAAEGDAIPTAGSLYGISYMMLVNEDGSLQYGTSTTPLVVDLGANNDVTVTGTVTANLSATDNAVLDDIVDGTLQVQVSGSALTALQLIDNPIFADDAAFTLASSSVMMAGAIRDDSLATLTAVEGDAVPLRVNANGALHVTGGGGGTEFNEDSAHTTGAAGSLPLAVRNDAGTALAADGDYIPLMVNASGALYVTGGGGGTEYVVNAVAPADPTGATFTMERDDALSALTEVEGDWTNPRSNANGALWTAVDGTVTVSATNLDVQSGGADLLTETTGAAILTSTNFAAAFGTAGSADTQVMSIQGIASMTPVTVSATNLDVQSGGADLATQTTLASVLSAFTSDPCASAAKSVAVVDIVTATTTEIINAVSGQTAYVCSVNLVTGGANNVALVEDDTDACASPTAGMAGGVTAAEGWNFAANGGLTLGNGRGTVAKSAAANRNVCLITSAAVQLSGTVSYVVQ